MPKPVSGKQWSALGCGLGVLEDVPYMLQRDAWDDAHIRSAPVDLLSFERIMYSRQLKALSTSAAKCSAAAKFALGTLKDPGTYTKSIEGARS